MDLSFLHLLAPLASCVVAMAAVLKFFVGRLDKKFDNIDKRFELIEKRFMHVDERFEKLEHFLDQKFERLNMKLDTIAYDVKDLNTRVTVVEAILEERDYQEYKSYRSIGPRRGRPPKLAMKNEDS